MILFLLFAELRNWRGKGGRLSPPIDGSPRRLACALRACNPSFYASPGGDAARDDSLHAVWGMTGSGRICRRFPRAGGKRAMGESVLEKLDQVHRPGPGRLDARSAPPARAPLILAFSRCVRSGSSATAPESSNLWRSLQRKTRTSSTWKPRNTSWSTQRSIRSSRIRLSRKLRCVLHVGPFREW